MAAPSSHPIPGARHRCARGVPYSSPCSAKPLDLYFTYQGAFGTWFSWQNTLTRAAPLILTALCTALPAQLGMVIIGGEGALLIGALAATGAALTMQSAPPLVVQLAMVGAGMAGGGLWIMLAGGLRQYRGVNETISSLFWSTRARHPQSSGRGHDARSRQPQQTLDARDRRRQHDRQHTRHRRALGTGVRRDRRRRVLHPDLSHRVRLRSQGGRRQHARRQDRGPRRQQADPDDLLSGGRRPDAGMVEVAAGQGRTNANLAAGYGFTGILVAFLARQNPLAVIPVAILLGGISASGGLLQRRLGLPDASVQVLQGIIFVFVLASEALYGRIGFLKGKS
jgi:simple sugar transport system permease protein